MQLGFYACNAIIVNLVLNENFVHKHHEMHTHTTIVKGQNNVIQPFVTICCSSFATLIFNCLSAYFIDKLNRRLNPKLRVILEI